ncbi:hemerythrin HHE cation binding domain-containing protein [Burkholderiales bacterium JOSHI_001]|nr:hemerythrin HHE cation binding domain-containing protein [Burkholderiales bacterium JOSHI_001]
MDITELLQQDHDALLRLARQMGQQDEADAAKALYRELRNLVTAHSRAEEAVVYRALDKLGQKKISDATEEGQVEHGLCDHLLMLMARGRAETAAWKAKAVVVHELLDHHVQEEKDEMFPVIRKHFDDEARATMGKLFEQRKALLLASSKAK